jgi:hypothetical protein
MVRVVGFTDVCRSFYPRLDHIERPTQGLPGCRIRDGDLGPSFGEELNQFGAATMPSETQYQHPQPLELIRFPIWWLKGKVRHHFRVHSRLISDHLPVGQGGR